MDRVVHEWTNSAIMDIRFFNNPPRDEFDFAYLKACTTVS